MTAAQGRRLYTPDQVAALFGVGVSSVRGWALRRRVPSVRIGGYYLHPADEVDALRRASIRPASSRTDGGPALAGQMRGLNRDFPAWRCWVSSAGRIYASGRSEPFMWLGELTTHPELLDADTPGAMRALLAARAGGAR